MRGMKKAKSEASEQHLQALAEHAEWEWLLGQVVGFRQQHGHVELGNHPAGVWLEGLRQEALAGKLSALKRQRLAEGGLPMPKAVRRRKAVPMTADLPKEEAAWERLYARLDAWQELHGHCKVPRAWGADPELARWTQEQRRRREQRRLTPSQEARLEMLGFIQRRQGTPQTAAWEERYAEMVAYQKEHGHTNVKKTQSRVLGRWRVAQRESRKMGMLSAERIARLDEIGFEWTASGREGLRHEEWIERTWTVMLDKLAAFKERFGHCHVPAKWQENEKLGSWVLVQRKHYRKGVMAEARVMRLEATGFQWEVPEPFFEPPYQTKYRPRQQFLDIWEEHYAAMVAFKNEYGHTNVTEAVSQKLTSWRDMQRRCWKMGTLRAERQARLEEIGFEWAPPQFAGLSREEWFIAVWEKKLKLLEAFYKRFGHTRVPLRWEEDPTLAEWCKTQTRRRQEGKLLPQQETRLEALGFFELREEGLFGALWAERYAEMVAFQKEHGHTNVTGKVNKQLSFWRDTQREFRKMGKLSAERIARLDEIGFEWEAPGRAGLRHEEWQKQLWETRWEELVAFKERYGHCHVPVEWEENLILGGWVLTQRRLQRQGKLAEARLRRLETLGFLWEPPARFFEPPFKSAYAPSQAFLDQWEERYAEMVAYQKEHGHTNVTKTQSRVLGRWRDAQRESRKMGSLRADRIARLDEIGFAWEAPGREGLRHEEWLQEVWEKKLKGLEAFKERYGHTRVPQKWQEDLKLAGWNTLQRRRRRLGKLPPMQEARLVALGFEWLG